MNTLPKGIWFEAKRQRYRVRVYRRSRVIHRSYHKSLDEAKAALREARKHRTDIRANEGPVSSVQDQVRALTENLI